MQYTYAGAANNTTNGVSLGNAGQDVRVYKVIIGVPVASGNITLYNSAVAFNAQSDNIAMKYTLGADIAPGDMTYSYSREIDLGEGLQLDGGNLQVDQAMQVTVVWDFADKD